MQKAYLYGTRTDGMMFYMGMVKLVAPHPLWAGAIRISYTD
ncbi:hypothetical protein ACOIOT_002534 [Cronobacter turicensis]